MKAEFIGSVTVMLLAFSAACGGERESQSTQQPAPSGAPAPSLGVESTATKPAPPTSTPSPDRPTVTPVPLIYPTFTPVPPDSPTSSPSSAIMEKLRPSMVRIRINDQDYGSGFVVEGGYVVTAAHVAWPYAAAGIVFEEGTEHANVPVIGYDHHADIAFLGPIDTSAPTRGTCQYRQRG